MIPICIFKRILFNSTVSAAVFSFSTINRKNNMYSIKNTYGGNHENEYFTDYI